jgi:GNAT superfamily N-acetyltransferase
VAGPDGPTLAVRRATAADALAIATVHVRSWQAAYPGLLPQRHLDGLDPRRAGDEWRPLLETTAWPTTGAFVLTDAGDGREEERIAGFAFVSPTRDEDDDPAAVGELQTLYLDPDYWHLGGGRTLLGVVQEQMKDAGWHTACAWVLESNIRARRFYERFGWRHDGAAKPHDWGTFVVTDVRYRTTLA